MTKTPKPGKSCIMKAPREGGADEPLGEVDNIDFHYSDILISRSTPLPGALA